MNTNEKKIVVRIHRPNANSVYGVLTRDIIQEVCDQTGLGEEEVLASLDKLQSMGVLDKEEAMIH